MVVLTQASFDLAVPKHLHSALIGKEGKIVKELMEATSTTIRIPKSDDPSNLIAVSGTTENIRAAIEKIQLLADEKVRSYPFSSIEFILRLHSHPLPVFEPSSHGNVCISRTSLTLCACPSSRPSTP